MVVDLKYPFTTIYKSGAVSQAKDGRRYITLTEFDGSQTVTTYARYLMSVHLGYFIPNYLEVDHKDNDKTNDCLSNYQLLTPGQNLQKYHEFCRLNKWEYIDLVCSNCNNGFTISKGTFDSRQKRNQNGTYFCSNKCYTEFISTDINLQRNIAILADENTSSIELSKKIGVSRSVVDKYRKTKFLEELPGSIISQIKEMDNSAVDTTSIAKKLSISFKAAKKYRNNHPKKGPGIKINNETIELIRSMDNPSITDSHIAKCLEIDNNTVAKYRENRPLKLDTDYICKRIKELDDGSISNRALARALNVTKETIKKYR